MKLPQLNLPNYKFKIQQEGGKKQIFDPIRKKFVTLTMEEWVRQNFVQYLIQEKKYPRGLTQIEASLKIYKINKRSDVIIFNRNMQPLVIVECKAPDIKITDETFQQIAVYNTVLKADCLLITNGLEHYCCRWDKKINSFSFDSKIPSYPELA